MVNFDDLKNQFLRIWASFSPIGASNEGWREFSGILPDLSKSKIQSLLMVLNKFKNELKIVDFNLLTEIEKMDYYLMDNFIDATFFSFSEIKVQFNNPIFYFSGSDILEYLLKQYAPLEVRINELINHFNSIPDYYKIAKENLVIKDIAPVIGDMALFMFESQIEFINNLEDNLKELEGFKDLKKDQLKILYEKRDRAIDAIRSFYNYLNSEKENFKGNYKLGKEMYSKMLYSEERVSLSLDKILKAGQKNLEHNLEEFTKAANAIDPNKSPQEIMAMIRDDHPTTDSILEDTQNMLSKIRNFLIDENFVSVPSKIMPKVIYTPKPQRRWAFAAMNSPGALEKVATDSYYYITPPEDDWTEKEKNDWLGTFNYSGLLDISVHEVFPGHYLHNLHNQRSKSLFGKLFGAYHFWEGYALYVEEAMWQHGFQKGDNRYRMAQLTETLLRNVRLINSIKLHTDPNYKVEDGVELFMKYAFLGKKPSESESMRGTYDPGYLNYCLGKLMIEKLRKDYEKEKGSDFNLKEFHDELLSFGAPPIPILRKFMLKNTSIHEDIL